MRKRKISEKLPFELENLDLIYNEMVAYMEEGPDKNKEAVIGRISQMTEFQLWGEKNNDAFFDVFCEKNILELMLKLLKTSTDREITIQVIQSLSMYLTNIKKPININYVLSNNSINEFIAHNFNFEEDEIVDFYISFLKSLALRLEVIPLELFYNEKYKNFPLMAQAVRFYNYPASMVRTSVQNITLTLFRLDDKKLQHYFSNFPFANYYVNISCYLRDIWLKIDEVLPDSTVQSSSKLRELLDDQYDLLMYIEDIFQLQKENINTILANALISYTIVPTLIVPFTSSKKGMISLNLSLYLINLLFNSITYTPILEFLFATLFSSKITPTLLEYCLTAPKEPLSYSKHWSFVNNWDLHEKTLNERYLALLNRIEEKPISPRAKSHSISKEEADNGQQEETVGPQLNINIDEEDKILSRSLGVVTDFSKPELEDLTKLSFLNLLEEFKKSFKHTGDEVSDAELSANPISEAFLSFFMSKDDNMILLLTNILNSVLNHKLIQPKLFGICNLNYEKNDILSQLAHESNEEQEQQSPRNQTALYILDCLYKLFIVDPPFRVITMRLITKLILQLSQHKKEKVMMTPENLRNFNIGYTNSINKVIKFVQNSITADFFVELFDVQWKSLYKKDFVKMDKKDFYYMLLPLIEEPIPGIDPYLRLPAGEYELAKQEISIFLLFRKIRYALIKTTKFSPQFIEDYGAGLRKENPSNYWEDGKYYSIEHKKLIPCTLKDEANKGTSCYIAEDDENFSVIKFDPNRIHWAQVLINIRLKYAEASVDRTEANTLIITMKVKDKYVDKKLSFTERTLCQAAKRTLEDNRRYAKHYEVSVLVKNFEQAKNDIYEQSCGCISVIQF